MRGQFGVTRNFAEGDYIAKLIERANLLHIPTNAGWTSTLVGSGAIVYDPSGLYVNTGTTTASSALVYCWMRGFIGTANSYSFIDWAKKFIFIFNIGRDTDNANIIARVQLKQASTEGALAARGIGIRMDNLALVGESYGTSLAALDLATNLTNQRSTQIKIVHTPSIPQIEWFVEGVLKGTQTTSAKIPQVANSNSYLVVSVLNGAGTSDGYNLFMHPKIIQVR